MNALDRAPEPGRFFLALSSRRPAIATTTSQYVFGQARGSVSSPPHHVSRTTHEVPPPTPPWSTYETAAFPGCRGELPVGRGRHAHAGADDYRPGPRSEEHTSELQ